MQRLPTEIYDHIIAYVAVLSDDPEYRTNLHLCPPQKVARLALRNLRLVDKAFSRCAPRQLFRGIRIRLSRGLSSISKFEALSSSDYARHVRLIQFEYRHTEPWVLARNTENEEDIDDEEEVAGGEFAKVSNEAVNRLSLVMAKFCNLNAVDIWSDQDGLPKTTMGFVPQIVTSIADLQLRGFLHGLTYLRAPVEGADYLKMLFEYENPTAAIWNFLRLIKELELVSKVETDDIDEWLDLINESCSEISNRVLGPVSRGYYFLPPPGFTGRVQGVHQGHFPRSHNTTFRDMAPRSVPVKKYKNLLYFSLEYYSLDGFWLENGITDILLYHALGDIQRQVNANRLAAGLKPFPADTFSYPSSATLKDEMTEEDYEELSSRNWDAERP